MSTLKNLAIATLLLLAVIVVLQNTETVETRLLFATITMSRALLLLLTLLVGVAAGLLFGVRLARRKSS